MGGCDREELVGMGFGSAGQFLWTAISESLPGVRYVQMNANKDIQTVYPQL